jgi:cytosine/adenosine deaminase-related metal-dependent hydrolase
MPPGPAGGAWHAELAWLPGGVQADVLIQSAGDRLTAVTAGVPAAAVPAGATRLAGLTLPGLANAHSHAFHRALRGATQAGHGTFWTWRDLMYEVAARLTPASYLDLATAVYAEMALAGVTCVGEFHYLHHQAGGAPYADPNEMGLALIEAAGRAGLRMTLLDTCYLSGGLRPDGAPLPLTGAQQRFGDGDADAWAERASALQLGPVVAWARQRGAPLHVHLSEQRAENEACLAAYGRTPAGVLHQADALGPRTTAVHATHLSAADLALLGRTGSYACFCPTTEADLADGIGPARALAAAGSALTVGSDSQAVIDLFEEARRIELGERLVTQERGHFTAARLAAAATADGHASLGWPDAGQLAAGCLADLVTVSLDTPRTAGTTAAHALESVMFSATAADVREVVTGGRTVVRDGQHVLVEDVPGALATAIAAVRA